MGEQRGCARPQGRGQEAIKKRWLAELTGLGGAFSAIQPLDSLLGGIVSTGFLLEGLTSVFPKVRSLGMLSVPCFCPSESHLFFQSPLSCTCTSHRISQHCFLLPFLSLRCSEGKENGLEVQNPCTHSIGRRGLCHAWLSSTHQQIFSDFLTERRKGMVSFSLLFNMEYQHGRDQLHVVPHMLHVPSQGWYQPQEHLAEA